MRITASPIAPASSFEIADAADAALLDVRREISIFMASIVRLRNYRVGRAGCRGALPRERFSRVPGMLNSSEVKVFHPA